MIKEVNFDPLIIKYQPEEDNEKISEKNKTGVSVMVKNALLNTSKAIPNYLL